MSLISDLLLSFLKRRHDELTSVDGPPFEYVPPSLLACLLACSLSRYSLHIHIHLKLIGLNLLPSTLFFLQFLICAFFHFFLWYVPITNGCFNFYLPSSSCARFLSFDQVLFIIFVFSLKRVCVRIVSDWNSFGPELVGLINRTPSSMDIKGFDECGSFACDAVSF